MNSTDNPATVTQEQTATAVVLLNITTDDPATVTRQEQTATAVVFGNITNTTVGDGFTLGTSSSPPIVKTLMQTLTENVGDSPGYVLQSLRTLGILYMLYYLVVLIYIAWKTNSLGRTKLSGETKNSNGPTQLERRESIGVVF